VAFDRLNRIMPDLIREMAEDVALDIENEIDEFVLLVHEGQVFQSQVPRFVYYESTHPDLRSYLEILETKGFIQMVSAGPTPIYRLMENFRAGLSAVQGDQSQE